MLADSAMTAKIIDGKGIAANLRGKVADAVHRLTAEPTGENVVRYLIASRGLERPDHAFRRRRTQGQGDLVV